MRREMQAYRGEGDSGGALLHCRGEGRNRMGQGTKETREGGKEGEGGRSCFYSVGEREGRKGTKRERGRGW